MVLTGAVDLVSEKIIKFLNGLRIIFFSHEFLGLCMRQIICIEAVYFLEIIDS